ncbi:MAG: stage II sporulation protein P [Anaerostipes sp.]|jgi:stage II sporulation protein P
MEKNKGKSIRGYIIIAFLLLFGSLWQGKEYAGLLFQEICMEMTEELFPAAFLSGQAMNESYVGYLKNLFDHEIVPIVEYVKLNQGGNADNLVETQLEESEEIKNKSIQENKKNWKKKWRNPNYLRKYVYQIDSTTMVTNSEINGARLLNMDLSFPQKEEPQILIYHTHGSEAYKDSKKGKKSDTVIGVGDVLTQSLRNKGFQVIHDRRVYDVKNGKEERSKAYTYAAASVEEYLKKYPSIQVIIDIHRDGVKESTHLVSKQNNKNVAQIMFFNGASRSAKHGEIKYLKNPNKINNFAFSLQLQAAGEKKYPGFLRKLYIKGYRYNLHYRGRSVLVEVGAQNNTIKQAKDSMPLLGNLLQQVLLSSS